MLCQSYKSSTKINNIINDNRYGDGDGDGDGQVKQFKEVVLIGQDQQTACQTTSQPTKQLLA